jgi:carboxypeptidase C (cathepsin A)
VSKLEFPDSVAFNSQRMQPYTVNGVEHGMFKTAGKLSYLEVYKAGHMVPAYQPIVALQVFSQTMALESLIST